jgi:dolichol-phosphate mannosyltransferase
MKKKNIVLLLKRIIKLYKSKFQILVIDDNSPDGTSEKVKEVISQTNNNLHLKTRKSKLGLGTAYLLGFKWAIENKFNYVISMDADFSHNPLDIEKLYNSCVYDNNVKGINVVNWPLERIILSYMASWYVRIITGMNIRDPTSGFVCYSIKTLKRLSLKSIRFNGYAFQIEMKFKLFLMKFILNEIPIIFTDREFGKSKLDGSIIGEAFFGVISMKLKSIFSK